MTSISNVCPVVRVVAKNSDGFTEINESDFKKDIHELFIESVAVVPVAVVPVAVVPPPPAPAHGKHGK